MAPLWSKFRGTTGWLTLLVFVSAWMFFLGILVGRGTVPLPHDPDKLQKKLAELKEADVKAKMSRVKINTDAEKTQKELGFYEALKESKNDTVIKKKKPPRIADKKPKQPLKKAPTVRAKKPKTPVKATPESKKTRSSAPADKSAKVEKNLAIQVGSFRNSKDAERLVRTLVEKGYPAFKTMGAVPDKGIWYRVRIGYFGTRAEAWETMKRLKKAGYGGFMVTK